MRSFVASLLAAGCVLALAACGGDSGPKAVDAATYASSVCSAIGLWQDRLAEGSAVFASRTETEKSLEKVRTQFVVFFGDALKETDAMLSEVEEAGVPDVTAGEQVSASLLAELRAFRPILVEARKQARVLPVGNEPLFTTKAQALGAEFRAEGMKLPTLLETVAAKHKVPELRRAARAEAACSQF